MQWYWLDCAILLVIGLSIITGLCRGFVKELIALCVWILAIWLAFTYSPEAEEWLKTYIQEKTVRTAVAFIAILVATLVIGGLVNAFLSFILRRSGLSGTDRLLGMGFGFIRGIFIVALLMLVVKMTSIPYQQYSAQSKLYAQFDPLVSWLSTFMPQFIKQVKTFDKDKIAIDITPAPQYIDKLQEAKKAG